LIRIKETFNKDKSITLHVDGRLDASSIPTLEDICRRHLEEGHKIILNAEGLYHISRKGKGFLDTIKDLITLEKIPSFLKIK
jgi:anti-anti-sigma regulatory factor